MYSVNVDNVDWITVKVSGRTEGEVKIILTAIEE
jgi:phage tail protein X